MAAEFTRAEPIIIMTRMCPWLRQSDCRVIEEILEGRKKVDPVLVHHVKEERLVQNGGCERMCGAGAGSTNAGLTAFFLMLNLAFSFQRLLVWHVEGSVLGELLVMGAGK